jgi:hypothetical protein
MWLIIWKKGTAEIFSIPNEVVTKGGMRRLPVGELDYS